ncbi:MAG TPA: HlyD family efflux transporter periplasmic adaptor subunit [Allosphingosinicella sp.]|nr:HlyD family efflux transporter periplasmic adaptor subunit [Allosphingosinicella sp.]
MPDAGRHIPDATAERDKVNAPHQSLFRKEVREHQAERLHGDVSIALPMSWQLIGYTLLATLAAALVFLSSASYSRVEAVSGAIVLDKGVASIMPSRRGIVTALQVSEGQNVRAGEPLVSIRSEEDMASGDTAPRRVIDALAEQDQRLASQTDLMMTAAAAERSRLAATIAGIGEELKSLETQISTQRRLVEVADNEFRQVQGIAGKGFISRRDVDARESALLARRQQLAQLEQARAAKRSDLAEGQRSIAQSGATAEAQAAGVLSSRAGLAQQRAQAESNQGYSLTTPVDGTVTALTARLGQPATEQQPLMFIMPANATPRAELYVPTSAAGFLEVGQEVRLAVDAFPYQRFGSVEARITRISSVAIPKATSAGETVPVYLVTAELSDPSVMAFGRKQPLLPGMTLSARIVTQRQTLVEWLFEPLFAVRNR